MGTNSQEKSVVRQRKKSSNEVDAKIVKEKEKEEVKKPRNRYVLEPR